MTWGKKQLGVTNTWRGWGVMLKQRARDKADKDALDESLMERTIRNPGVPRLLGEKEARRAAGCDDEEFREGLASAMSAFDVPGKTAVAASGMSAADAAEIDAAFNGASADKPHPGDNNPTP